MRIRFATGVVAFARGVSNGQSNLQDITRQIIVFNQEP